MVRADDRLTSAFHPITRLPVDLASGRIFEHGWQSWSPSATYALDESPIRPRDERIHRLNARPGTDRRVGQFRGEGLLAVRPAIGEPVHVFAARKADLGVPTITARLESHGLAVFADDDVEHRVDPGPGGLEGALARWADAFAARAGVPAIRRPPTAWCTWYHYFTNVTAADVRENLRGIRELELPADVVQVDDGWQAGIGDWAGYSPAFADFPALVGDIRSSGLRAGVWLAPFLVGSRSATAAAHPDWLVSDGSGPIPVGRNWDQDLFALDTTHPSAAASLTAACRRLVDLGIDYFKVDFIWSAAVPGHRREAVDPLEAYRRGVDIVRKAIGDAYLLGCGAPVLPSVGLFDAMRVGPDTAPHWEPRSGDLSDPGAHSAVVTSAARAFMHGRFWTNDPDCLLVRPAVERREEWAAHVARFGGLRVSSDRLADLDTWGIEVTREILGRPAPDRFIPG